ncbi:MAG: hypothetical protein EZS28_024750 [Streblomastix strix]|uniref:Mariner Mos1 transposase n=1 Tax=Streblomastix strix TaxID=222440 RepID=A0A5J4VBB5_9EUKA|nr:MAG: hypothetical protein EZS28_024750 [Streblomastix strix]
MDYIRVCLRQVPHVLSTSNFSQRVQLCRELLPQIKLFAKTYFINVITLDETWVFMKNYQPSIFIKKGGKQPERPRKTIADEKRMFTVYLLGGDIQFVHFLPKGTTMDSKMFTSEVIKPLQQKYIKEYHAKRGEYYLHFDNAPIHKSQCTQTYTIAGIFSVLKHPPFSPGISSSGHYIFVLQKQELKGIMMNSEEQMKTEVGKILNEIRPIEIQRALRNWSRRLEYIIQHDGACYNKDKW